MKEELRLYSFVNFYLSSIQQGIQTGHLTDNMSVRYLGDIRGPERDLYIEWITKHKTYIVLNGGDSAAIYENYVQMSALCQQLKLPYGSFNEPGCNDMKTCYGVVVPEKYFNAERSDEGWMYYFDTGGQLYATGSPEWEFITLIKSASLAR